MSAREVRPTNCHFCGYLCAFNATVEDDRVIALEPDQTRYPYDERILRGCRRWKTNVDFLDAPDRINYPLRRVGERGANKWERVSWEEALDDISKRLASLVETHGARTVASAIGGPHASFWPLHRFMNLLGSPNNMGIGQICWNPRIWMDAVTFGWTLEADLDPERTKALFLWGTNPAQSDNSAFWQTIRQFAQSSTPVVVIDPRRTQTAACADIWLPIQPGTDCELALAMLHTIIEEELFDKEFTARWCHGFDELAQAVAAFSPEAVARVCNVPACDIRAAARIFAHAEAAALVSGRGIDQIGANVAPTHRALCCLRAITGNVDKPGACALTQQSDFTPEVALEMSESLSEEARRQCLNASRTPLQSYEGYERVNALTRKLGRSLPMRYLTSAHPDLVLRAMLEADPYPVRALIVQATNPLLTYADTKRVFDALSSLDLLVVMEYCMTPTASLADYVLPVAGALERPTFQAHGGVANIAYGGPAAVAPYYERRTDYAIMRELGIRMGQGDFWPDETLEEAYARTLADAGMTWSEYCAQGIYGRAPGFFKHEMLAANEKPQGFATTTGKIELASEVLGILGGFRVPQPAPRPAAPDAAERAPLTLITGARKQPYNASMFFNNEAFRRTCPEACAEVSPATAQKLGIAEGAHVEVRTEHGSARFTLHTAPMTDGVVSVDYGWWHPEQTPGAPDFGGIWESNANLLTSCSLENGEPTIGTWSYNAISCTLHEVEHIQ